MRPSPFTHFAGALIRRHALTRELRRKAEHEIRLTMHSRGAFIAVRNNVPYCGSRNPGGNAGVPSGQP